MSNTSVYLDSFNMADPVSALKVGELPFPANKEGHVIVKMTVRPVNPADAFSVMGVYPGFKPEAFPAVPGLEGCGVVHDSNGTALVNGQRVVVIFHNGGSWQSYVSVAVENCVPIPDNVSDDYASQAVVNPMSALGMISELNIPQGKFLVQSAAGSVLGRMVMSICKARGIKTVNIVRRQEQVAELASLGDVVLSSEEHGDGLGAAIMKATNGEGAFGGIDCVGGKMTKQIMNGVGVNGVVLIYGAMDGIEYTGSSIDAMFRNVSVKGFWIAFWIKKLGYQKVFEEVFSLMQQGVIVPFVGEHFDLKDAAAAFKHANSSKRGGKVLLVSS